MPPLRPKTQFKKNVAGNEFAPKPPVKKEFNPLLPPLRPKTQIEKRVVGNEFSPKPPVKKESKSPFLPPPRPKTQFKKNVVEFSPKPKRKEDSSNSFMPPLPTKKLAGPTADPIGSTKKQPTTPSGGLRKATEQPGFWETQSELPVQALETPSLSTGLATDFDRQASESSAGWWLLLLPIIPLLLIGWLLKRALTSGGAKENYRRPVAPVEPEQRQDSRSRTIADSMEANRLPEPAAASGLRILREEDIEDTEVCETNLDAATGCCSTDEQVSNCCNVSEAGEQWKRSKIEPKPEPKSTVEKSQSLDVVSDKPVVASGIAKNRPLPPAPKPSRKSSQSSNYADEQKLKPETVVSKKTVEKQKTFKQRTTEVKAESAQPIVGKNSEVAKPDSVTSISRSTAKTDSDDRQPVDRDQGKSPQPAKSVSEKTKFDDLTKIRGIGPDEASQLKASGIDSYSKLSKAGPDQLMQILKSGGSKFQFINPTQWPDQAELAAKGDWKGLSRWKTYHKELPNLNEQKSPASTTGVASDNPVVDFTKIRGISPEVAKLLRVNGIYSYRKLSKLGPERLKQLLHSGGAKFQSINPTQWPEQAALGARGDWDGLIRWQAKFKELPSLKPAEASPKKEVVQQTAKRKVEKSSASDKDDLTRINGIGGATQRFLNKKGISSYSQLASMDNKQLEELFVGRENRFQLLNTETWAVQAKQAMESTTEESQSAESNSESKPSITNILNMETSLNPTDQQVSN